MLYSLQNKSTPQSTLSKLKEGALSFSQYLGGEGGKLGIVAVTVLINSGATILTPYLISQAIDTYISKGNLDGLPGLIGILLIVYLAAVIAGYLQARIMGRLSQRTLFRLRQGLFAKIQSLPIAFFNQNKAGDLISRLNNDTDKLNQFLSESLLRFVSVFFSLIGIGIFVFFLNVKMAVVMLLSTIIIFIFTKVVSSWSERVNKESLEATGNLSAEVQEGLSNFKAIVAFNRQDYLVQKLTQINSDNYQKTIKAQISSGLFNPVYNFAGNIAQVIVLVYGIYLISQSQFTVGLLIGFLTYTQKFYEPLRILGTIWGSLQGALAAWVRVQEILRLKSNLKVIK